MFLRVFLLSVLMLVFSGCASSALKERQVARDRVAAQSGLYCDFVSGDMHPDIDVELNLRMAKKCSADKNISLTDYRNSSGQQGVIFCCAHNGEKPAPAARSRSAKPPEAAGN